MGPNVVRNGMENRWAQVGGEGFEWAAVCHDWWEGFAEMSKAAWQEGFQRMWQHLRLVCNMRTMKAKHIALGWSKTLWAHMWNDHMYPYVNPPQKFNPPPIFIPSNIYTPLGLLGVFR